MERMIAKATIHGEAARGRTTLRYIIWNSAKMRARCQEIPFDLELSDITIPEICPILGLPLKSNKGGRIADSSPTLDRIFPEKGYVKGNVWVISNRANKIKSNFAVEELEKVYTAVLRKTEEIKSAMNRPA